MNPYLPEWDTSTKDFTEAIKLSKNYTSVSVLIEELLDNKLDMLQDTVLSGLLGYQYALESKVSPFRYQRRAISSTIPSMWLLKGKEFGRGEYLSTLLFKLEHLEDETNSLIFAHDGFIDFVKNPSAAQVRLHKIKWVL